MKSLVFYCDFRKFAQDSVVEINALKLKLEESEQKLAEFESEKRE